MRMVPARRGQFAQRPHYKLPEIERACGDALRHVGLMPEIPEAIRIDRFVEKYFRVSPTYKPLPTGVLGFTEFGPDGVKAIVVTTALDDEGGPVAERRIRTTLAHEAGHGLLHAHLFALCEKPRGLFDEGHNHGPEIMCRDVCGATAANRTYDGKWWEFQANRAIGSLLMPSRLARLAAAPFCASDGQLGIPVVKEEQREHLARELAELFDVNPIVARIRLSEVYPAPAGGQLCL